MRAVLVGLVGRDKLFYDLDSKSSARDGILERENGSTVRVNFLSFAANSRDLKKIRSSTFHRFLWDTPANTTSGAWYESFVRKSRDIKDEMLEKIETHSSLGESRKKIKSKSDSVSGFISETMAKEMLANGCCGEMIKFYEHKNSFVSPEMRKMAWYSMNGWIDKKVAEGEQQ